MFLTLFTRKLASRTEEMAAKTGEMADSNSRMVEANQEMLQENRRMVELNQGMLQEMRDERESRERPRVRMDLDYSRSPKLFLVVRNLGGGPAVDLGVTFGPDPSYTENRRRSREMARGREGDDVVSLQRSLKLFEGIDFLPAGGEFPVFLGGLDPVVKYFREHDLARTGLQVRMVYESLDGTVYREEDAVLNPIKMADAAHHLPPDPRQLVRPALEVMEKLAGSLDHRGYLKVETETERERRDSAMWQRTFDRAAETERQLKEQGIHPVPKPQDAREEKPEGHS